MQFDLVDNRGIGGNCSARTLGAEGKLIREIEAVDTAGSHQLEGIDEAWEHGTTDDMDDGFAVAIGLVDGLTAEEVEATIVETDAFSKACLAAFALGEDLVVESLVAHLVTLDGGICFDKIVEINLLQTVDLLGHVLSLVLEDCYILHVYESIGFLGHLVGEMVLRTAFQGVGESLENDVVVEDGIQKDAMERHVGKVLAIAP